MRLTILGDSIARRFAEVTPEIGGNPLRNAGRDSDRTFQMLARVDAALEHTDLLIILGGVNDIADGRDMLAETAANLTVIAESAEARGITPLLCTLLPWNLGGAPQKDALDALNVWIRATASVRRWPCADLFTALEAPTGSRTSDQLPNGLYPGAEGIRRMVAALDAALPC